MINKLYTIVITLIVGGCLNLQANDICYTKQDSLIFEAYIKDFQDKRQLNISELTIATAKYFLNRPYVAHTLEINNKEKLVVNLREFDCTTYVENCMALARTLKEDSSFSTFTNWLRKIRYRNGEIADYTSRLHYISDWGHEHVSFLEDVGENLQGELSTKEINFMSKNFNLYKHLKNDSANQDKIKNIENSLNKRAGLYVILKKHIDKNKNKLFDGDIVVFATSIPGLDFSHVGFIYHENNVLKFIHASSIENKTVIESKSLHDYCFSQKNCIGVTILRQKYLK